LREAAGWNRRQAVIPESQRPTSRLGESAASRTSFASDQFLFSGAKAGQRVGQWLARALAQFLMAMMFLMASNH
jgi:hypothetical protein